MRNSFSIPFHNGEIWIEHLDSLANESLLLKEKFLEDLKQIQKPSTSSFIAINLDESTVTEELLTFILTHLTSLKKPLRKVVFVGLNLRMRRFIKSQSLPFLMHCTNDFEKAKEWLI